jgi:hypothetical protein
MYDEKFVSHIIIIIIIIVTFLWSENRNRLYPKV